MNELLLHLRLLNFDVSASAARIDIVLVPHQNLMLRFLSYCKRTISLFFDLTNVLWHKSVETLPHLATLLIGRLYYLDMGCLMLLVRRLLRERSLILR